MIKKILTYVEIKTKITSLFAFFMTLAFIFYSRQTINLKLTSIFFLSMFLFDLTTTAINNYIDSKDHPHMLPFRRKIGKMIIYAMFSISTALGLYLAYSTDVVVLILGGICFMCGVFYTYGPVPISRQPLGEVLSGVFYGAYIPFILLYINMPQGTYITLSLNLVTVTLSLQLLPLITVFLLAIPPTCATANIMLANNTCDVDADILVKRFTLPYYIGKKAAVNLFTILYLLAYIAPCVMVIFNMLNPITLLMFITLPLVVKNIKIFRLEQNKETTFIVSIKNYILVMGSYTIVILLGGIVERLF